LKRKEKTHETKKGIVSKTSKFANNRTNWVLQANFENSLFSPHYLTTKSSFRHIFFCGQSYFKTRENEVKENTSTRQLNSSPPTKANAPPLLASHPILNLLNIPVFGLLIPKTVCSFWEN